MLIDGHDLADMLPPPGELVLVRSVDGSYGVACLPERYRVMGGPQDNFIYKDNEGDDHIFGPVQSWWSLKEVSRAKESAPRCGTCKHFRRGYFSWLFPGVPKYDNLIEVVNDNGAEMASLVICEHRDDPEKGMCTHPSIRSNCVDGWLDREKAPIPKDGVVASCDEDRGALEIYPDFGCIHHEEK